MKRQENGAVIAWRGAATAGLVSSADRAYMKAPSLVLRRTSGQNVPKSGERANAGTRRRNGAGSLFGENGNGKQNGGNT